MYEMGVVLAPDEQAVRLYCCVSIGNWQMIMMLHAVCYRKYLILTCFSNTLRPGTMTTHHVSALIFVDLKYCGMGVAGLNFVDLLYGTGVGLVLEQ